MKRGKRAAQAEAIPVDKVDVFLRTNYKKILYAAGIIVLAVIVGYGVSAVNTSNNAAKSAAIGEAEFLGLSYSSQIDAYAALASSLPFAKDYINLKAAILYARAGERDKALNTLALVGGELAPYARSLHYDLSQDTTMKDAPLAGGVFASLWDYRKIEQAEGDERAKLAEEFAKKYPSSKLLQELERYR